FRHWSRAVLGSIGIVHRRVLGSSQDRPTRSFGISHRAQGFREWTKDVLGSVLLADNIRTLRRSQLKGEDLRLQLIEVVQEWAQRVSSPQPSPNEEKNTEKPVTNV